MKNILILLLLAFSINAYALISNPNGYDPDPDKRSDGSGSYNKTECIGGVLFASKQKQRYDGGVALVQILDVDKQGVLRAVRCEESDYE